MRHLPAILSVETLVGQTPSKAKGPGVSDVDRAKEIIRSTALLDPSQAMT